MPLNKETKPNNINSEQPREFNPLKDIYSPFFSTRNFIQKILFVDYIVIRWVTEIFERACSVCYHITYF